MDHLITKKKLLDGRVSKKLKRKIIDTLVDGAQGMFRWVQMSLESLCYIKYKPDFEHSLGRLPVKLSGLYDVIHNKIDQTAALGRNVAIKTLKWLLCAQRLLSVEELLAAVGVSDSELSSESDEDDGHKQSSSSENDVLRLCRNSVVLDAERRTFRFAHQSVQEYLLEKPAYAATEQHCLATESCIDTIPIEPPKRSEKSIGTGQKSLFNDYAMVYWPVHYYHIESCEFQQTQEKVHHFLMQEPRPSPSFVRWASDFGSRFHPEDGGWAVNECLGLSLGNRLGFKFSDAWSGPELCLSVACAFGFAKFLKENFCSTWKLILGQNPISPKHDCVLIAVEESHCKVVKSCSTTERTSKQSVDILVMHCS